jgi:hypothetical protein
MNASVVAPASPRPGGADAQIEPPRGSPSSLTSSRSNWTRSRTSCERARCGSSLLERDKDNALPLLDRNGLEGDGFHADMLAGLDAVLEAVPRADHMGVSLVPALAAQLLLVINGIEHARQNLPLARRAAHVHADVEIGVEPVLDPKDANRSLADIDHEQVAVQDVLAIVGDPPLDLVPAFGNLADIDHHFRLGPVNLKLLNCAQFRSSIWRNRSPFVVSPSPTHAVPPVTLPGCPMSP